MTLGLTPTDHHERDTRHENAEQEKRAHGSPARRRYWDERDGNHELDHGQHDTERRCQSFRHAKACDRRTRSGAVQQLRQSGDEENDRESEARGQQRETQTRLPMRMRLRILWALLRAAACSWRFCVSMRSLRCRMSRDPDPTALGNNNYY